MSTNKIGGQIDTGSARTGDDAAVTDVCFINNRDGFGEQ